MKFYNKKILIYCSSKKILMILIRDFKKHKMSQKEKFNNSYKKKKLN